MSKEVFVFPTSFAQQRLWFLDQLEPGNSFYNIATAVRLRGPLAVAAIEQTLNEIVRRHETLRTTFKTRRGLPVQVIRPARPFTLPAVDISHLDAPEREAEVMRRASAEAERPFDLVRGPLLRALLIKAGGEDHVLVLTMHHIVADAWSLDILIRELVVLYRAFAASCESPLPELSIQYADYACWQRDGAAGGMMEEQLGYWKQRLEGVVPLELPAERPRPPVQTYRGATHSFRLADAIGAGLRELARREGVTLFMLLLACFKALLLRYTGQEDIAVGTPVANRTRGEVKGLIGFFGNMLVLRTDLAGDPSFLELLRRVREAALGAYAHQDLPFERLVEELQPERDLSRHPLFQVMFSLLHAPETSLDVSGLTLSPIEISHNTAKFDLTLSVQESGGRLTAQLEYNTDLFEAATIERLTRHFTVLLEGVVLAPRGRVSELPLLTEAETRQLLGEWNETARPYPSELCLHELLEAQARRTPEAVAVVSEGGGLTYGELNERAERLARRLRWLGVGPDVPVAVYLERSAEMLVALLGVLKAGGAYVPLDTAYPRERLAFMLEDSGAAVVLTRGRAAGELPAGGRAAVLRLDGPDEDESMGAGVEERGGGVTPDNLAYIIYTSGSTGVPKGVAVTHRSVVNFLEAMRREPGLDASDTLLAVTTLSFDIAGLELYLPLAVGGRVVVLGRDAAADGERLLSALEEHGATVMQATPATWRLLLAADWQPRAGRFRVLCGGEALDAELAARLLERAPAVFNLFGPTETTIWSTLHRLAHGERPISIGRPIANTQLYILDRRLRPVPVGVKGRLYIAGAGLARGYLARPALTAEKFIPNPFAAEAGQRMYATGDLARYLPDGRLEFLGRDDQQVKVRGHRIEPGEVEAALRRHEAVREAVVLAREDVPGDKRLVAYVTTRRELASAHAELRDFARARLPEYAVPTAFVLLEELPLTPNRKVDRKALPAPEQGRLGLSASFVAPRTPAEELLAGIFAEVLALERVGVNDSFFELGGHSLLATQAASRIKEAFGVELPLRAVFQTPTVAGLCQLLEVQRGAGAADARPPLRPVGREHPLLLSFAQQRLWFLKQLAPGDSSYNMPAVLRVEGALNVAALERSLSELVRRHESLRTTFTMPGEEPVQVIAPPRRLALPVTDLSHVDEGEREAEAMRLAAAEGRRPFDMERGPLMRARLLRLGADRHVLLVTMHHIISDGWSTGVFVRECAALYEAFAAGRPSPLPELPIQYADYAHWQRTWLRGEVLESHLSYWKKQLAGVQALELPTDFPRPPVESFNGAVEYLRLPAELVARLASLSRRAGATTFMTLLSAFQVLLHRYTGQEDIAVGSPIAGRNRADIEGLIGFFANTLVLRTDLSGDPTFTELLRRTREVCLGAYAHQDLPFERLVEELQPERNLSSHALFHVLFILQNTPMPPVALPGVRLEPVEVHNRTSKFDISLFLGEDPEGIAGVLEYSTDLYTAESVRRMLGHYRVLLEGIAADPSRRISGLPLLTAEERRQLVHDWNDTRADFRLDCCVHERVAHQVALTPDAPAVSFRGTTLTYAELNRRANRLAHYLIKLGVGPDVLVGICVERSLEMVVGLLAVLKAGGAGVALDLAYPQERLAYMIEDAQMPVLLTQERLVAELPETGAAKICLDTCAASIAAESDADPAVRVTPDNLMYAIFTSGSTGLPKSIGVTHRAFLNLLEWQFQQSPLRQRALTVQYSTFGFCVSFQEIFSTWCGGGTLYVVPETMRRDMEALAEFLDREGVEKLHLPFAALKHLAEATAHRGRGLCGLREVITAGEQLQITPSILKFFERQGGSSLHNHYGASETHVVSSLSLSGPPESWPVVPPVGRPVANSRIYICDKNLEPVAIGVPGDIYVGGVCLARGYLRDPALTAEKFVPDPFSGEPGARLYRTGDLARFLPDGNIQHLGRSDGQVKVRGFRIELGEVETLLVQHPEVRDATVVVSESEQGLKRLVAYVIPAEPGRAAAGDLDAFLKKRLPEYMVPSAFVNIDALPLNANGKLDQQALPPVKFARPDTEGAYAPPRTPAEERLARIWAEVLGVERVSIHDSFFKLGGHSLSAVHLVSKVRRETGRSLPLYTVFSAPTVAQFASLLEEEGTAADASPIVVPIRPQGTQPPLWCVHPAGGQVLIYQNLAGAFGPEQPLLGLQSRALSDPAREYRSIEEMAAAYADEIRRRQPEGPYRLLGWSLGGIVAVSVADELEHEGQQVDFVGLLDARLLEDEPEAEESPFSDLALVFGGTLAAAFEALSPPERASLLDELAPLPPAERLRRAADWGRRRGLLTDDTPLEVLEQQAELARLHRRLAVAHRPPLVRAPFHAWWARAGAEDDASPEVWGRHTASGVYAETVEGNHFTMMRPPHCETLAASVAARLGRLRNP